MKFVEIYKIENDGSQKVVATCKLTGKKIECEGDKVFIENLKIQGIPDYSSKPEKNIFPEDGIKFLENLKFAFKSGYLNASDIKEK